MQDILCTIRKSIFNWVKVPKEGQVLWLGEDADLEDLIDEVWLKQHEGLYCAVVAIESWEKEKNVELLLANCRRLLSSAGKLYLGMNNRLGLRYFCGDKDKYTEQCFDGIDGYRLAYGKDEDRFGGRMYSQAEIRAILRRAGFGSLKFYSVLPDLDHPAFLFAENFIPNEDLTARVFPFYNNPGSVFLEEEYLYSSLCAEGMFHKLANAFFVECIPDGMGDCLQHSDVQHVTCSAERGSEYGLYTIIHESGLVEKRPLSPTGELRLKAVQDNMDNLQSRGVKVIESRFCEGHMEMPFVTAPLATVYLRDLLRQDKEKFLQTMDHFMELILQSSTHMTEDKGDGEGAILQHGYFDMVPLNCFFIDGEFSFFDQEFALESYPANIIMTRVVDIFYGGDKELHRLLPEKELLDRYNLTRYVGRWRRKSYEFLSKLRNLGSLHDAYAPHQRDNQQVFQNRQRINYTEEEYQRLFVDIFAGLEEKEMVLFGSGQWAQRFLDGYGREHNVRMIVDNMQSRWGSRLRDIPIVAPNELLQLKPEAFKVLICIKGYQSVAQQLEAWGIKDYSIFDPTRSYPHKRARLAVPKPVKAEEEKQEGISKKYKIGYIAGVFDLFHIGHLNMFKRAKEQCEYLIVGVVSDEGVRKNKGTEPFIPFEERVEMVRSCRYVDEAHEIPLTYAGTREAWELYHFDVQFSGSDYEGDPGWMAGKDFLEKHGATLVFFPYTQQTSSTKIKSIINRRLSGKEV